MADKKTDFEELFGKKEPEKKPRKAASAPTQRKAPAASAPKQSASAVRKENKSGLAGGAESAAEGKERKILRRNLLPRGRSGDANPKQL